MKRRKANNTGRKSLRIEEGAIVVAMEPNLLSIFLKRFNQYRRGVYSRRQNVVKQKQQKIKILNSE